MTAENDSTDLEALFDSIATSIPDKAPEPAASATDDSDDLQALFDSVSADFVPPPPVAAPAPAPAATASASAGDEAAEAESGSTWPAQDKVFHQIGQMARQLHDTIRELGYDKVLEKTVTAIPDAKDRLAYVANLTEQAACRVLNATDVANPLLNEVENQSRQLGARWDKVFANASSIEDFKALAIETRQFLGSDLPGKSQAMRGQLTEIMMAQDFQDLTGQVIKKIVTLAQDLESGLMGVLVEVVPEERRTDEVESLMNGPVVNADGRADVVVNQQQVDDLLESLGF